MKILVILSMVLLAGSALAETYGTTDSSGTGATNGDISSYRYAIPITIGGTDQIADSGYFWPYDFDTNTSTIVAMALYEVAGVDTSLIDSTAEGDYGPTEDQAWLPLPFTGVTLSASTTYLLAVHASNSCLIKRWYSAGDNRLYDFVGSFSSWDDPWSGAATVADMTTAIYLVTTAGEAQTLVIGAPSEGDTVVIGTPSADDTLVIGVK